MKVLVLGNGYIGSRVAESLSKRENGGQPQENVCQTVPPSGNRPMGGQPHENGCQTVQPQKNGCQTVHTVDIKYSPTNTFTLDIRDLKSEFFVPYDVVIFLAGNSSVANSKDLESTFTNNVTHVIQIAKCLQPTQKFIYASSASVYGNSSQENIQESQKCDFPINYYDASKLACDQIIRLIPNLQYFGLRFGTVCGFSKVLRTDVVVNAMIHSAKTEGRLKLVYPPLQRGILGLDDLCRAIQIIIDEGNMSNSGIYNLASFNTTTKHIAEHISQRMSVPIEEVLSTKGLVSYNFSLNTEQFCKAFHFRFQDTLDSVITEILTHWSEIEQKGPRSVDEYKSRLAPIQMKKLCRVCDFPRLHQILDLGYQPLANNIQAEPSDEVQYFPLRAMWCETCTHVQLSHTVNPSILYKNYCYVSGTSQTLLDYFQWLCDDLVKDHPTGDRLSSIACNDSNDQPTGDRSNDRACGSILEIACNDGSQLDCFRDKGWHTYGIDPAENLHAISTGKGHTVINDFLSGQSIQQIAQRVPQGKVDVILAENVLGHVDNVREFMVLCKQLMHDTSRLIIQTSQANMIRENQYDTMYHEHLSFFSVTSMNYLVSKCGLFLNNIRKVPIHGTSFLFEIGKVLSPKSNTMGALEEETKLGIKSLEFYRKYEMFCMNRALLFLREINRLLTEGYRIISYGASAKGNTVLNHLHLNSEKVSYILDDAPAKVGKFTPGSNIPILAPSHLETETHENIAVIMLTWNFAEEIKQKLSKFEKLNFTYVYY